MALHPHSLPDQRSCVPIAGRACARPLSCSPKSPCPARPSVAGCPASHQPTDDMTLDRDPLLTDLYQLNMVQAYLDHGETGVAVFEFFMRPLPARRRFLLSAGLEQVLDFLEGLQFSRADLDWLASTGRFGTNLIDYLGSLRFTGDVHAMPEGTACFGDEPILRVTAPLPVAQFIETRIINLLHFEMLIAAK